MAKPSVQTERSSEQDTAAELMSIGGTHDDRLQLARTGEHTATLTVLESDFGYLVGDAATVEFAGAADVVHIALTSRGIKASAHRQNLWKNWVHTAMGRWLSVGYPADVLGVFDFEGTQVRITRYTSTRFMSASCCGINAAIAQALSDCQRFVSMCRSHLPTTRPTDCAEPVTTVGAITPP